MVINNLKKLLLKTAYLINRSYQNSSDIKFCCFTQEFCCL